MCSTVHTRFSGHLTLGNTATGNGGMAVSAAGSLSANSISVGNFGTGDLSITNGGTVSSGFGYLGYESDSSGTAAVGRRGVDLDDYERVVDHR